MMRRAWAIWATGVAAYAAAVLQRTSLGVAGLEAAQHFGVSAGVLSTFVVVQLLVYSGVQIPAGVLLDRFGSRAMLASGSLLMCVGQTLMAASTHLSLGITARVIVGAGDAFIFGSALQLLPAWFPGRWVPILSQVTGLVGVFGQLASATVMLSLLHTAGWAPTFLACAGVALVAALATGFLVRDRPLGAPPEEVPAVSDLPRELAAIWKHPGTQLGLWTHFTTGFASTVFAMMWGLPFLIKSEGLSPAAASGYYSLFVALSAFFGPMIGLLTGRHPLRRSNLAFAVIAANALPWIAVLAWPGPAPGWLLVLLMAGLASGGPGSAIGFDFARTSMPRHRLGTATGIVIIGAFAGAIIAILAIGVLLDQLSPDGSYPREAFRLAMLAPIPLWIVGTIGIVISRSRLRKRMAAAGVVVPPWRDVLNREQLRRRYRNDG